MSMRDWLSCRLAPLRDDGVFDIADDAPSYTGEGRPWLRWANLGATSGWYAIGSMLPECDFGSQPDFWSVVLALGTEAGNGRYDAAHCIGPGVLSLGGIGMTLTSPEGVALLGRALDADPVRFLSCMAPAICESSAYPTIHVEAPLHEGSWQLCHVDLGILKEPHEIAGAVRRGSTGERWTRSQKRMAQLWVEGASRLLASEELLAVQRALCAKVPSRMSEEVRARLDWPSNGSQDAWMFTAEQQVLWATAMVAFLEDPCATESLILSCVQTYPHNARTSLSRIEEGVAALDVSERFRSRLISTAARLREIYRTG